MRAYILKHVEIVIPAICITVMVALYLKELTVLSALNERLQSVQLEIHRARESSGLSRGPELNLVPDQALASNHPDVIAGQQILHGILSDISKRIPDFAWLTELSITGRKILFKGMAVDSLTVANFVKELGGSDLISRLEITAVKQREKDGVYLQDFSVEAQIH